MHAEAWDRLAPLPLEGRVAALESEVARLSRLREDFEEKLRAMGDSLRREFSGASANTHQRARARPTLRSFEEVS